MSSIHNTLENVYTRLKKTLKKIIQSSKQEMPKLAWIPLHKKNNNGAQRF